MQDKTEFSPTDELSHADFEQAELADASDTARLEPQDEGRFEEELAATLSTVDGLIREIDRSNLTARYLIGREVQKVQSNAEYGDSAVEYLATKLGVSPRSLRTHARVAAVFPDLEKFEEMTTAERPHARPMTWAHVVELATAEQSLRDALIKKTIDEGLTVDALRAAKADLSELPGASANRTMKRETPGDDLSATASVPAKAEEAAAADEAEARDEDTADHEDTADRKHETKEPSREFDVAMSELSRTLTSVVRAHVDLSEPKQRRAVRTAAKQLRTTADQLEAWLAAKSLDPRP